ncbi:MFS transporter [Halobacillus amylolyticus]|uniref:MFS transporter n=1 Tax=Halobacillus amylolyticus TaxID=2932259 RepID=A0ABY4H8J1_9BACI|nr:MFS transporter [Halobacillus amylolyticus]UOR10768.1 MFS transporter [Halobacillus amylolyticus]
MISFLGDQIYLLALPLIVLALTGSPLAMGIVAALERLPVLLQPLAGVIADRFHRKGILLFCDAGRGVIVGAVGVLFIRDTLMMWQLYSTALLIGTLSQLYNTAQFATIPQLVRNNELAKANAVNTGLFQTAVLVGPGLGGILINAFHLGYALIANSLSFFLTFCAVSTLTIQPPAKDSGQKRVMEDIKEGFSYVLQTKPILFTNLAMLFSIFGTTLFLTMMVFYMRDGIRLTVVQIGWVLSFGGAAAVGGAILTSVLRKWWTYRQILFTASLVGGMSIIGFSHFQSFWWLGVMNAVGTFCAAIKSPSIVTIRQRLTPNHLLGRVQATSRFMTWMLMPAAALMAGIISEWASTETTIFWAGVIVVTASTFYLHPSLKTA